MLLLMSSIGRTNLTFKMCLPSNAHERGSFNRLTLMRIRIARNEAIWLKKKKGLFCQLDQTYMCLSV